MKIKKKNIFRFFGPFFSSFIIFGWDFVENEKNHQKSTVILLHFWLSKQKNYFWSHAKLAKMSSFQCTVGGVSRDPQKWLRNMCTTPTTQIMMRSGHLLSFSIFRDGAAEYLVMLLQEDPIAKVGKMFFEGLTFFFLSGCSFHMTSLSI